jgi:polysaccharide export outer membrane protein
MWKGWSVKLAWISCKFSDYLESHMYFYFLWHKFRFPAVLITVACFSTLPRATIAQVPVSRTPDSVHSGSEISPVGNRSVLSDRIENPTFAAGAYILGPGDRLALAVLGYEEFKNEQLDILPDGTISLPLIGSVRAAGQSLDALTQEITSKLQPYLVNPNVSLSLVTLRPVRVVVAGQVQRPGPQQLISLNDTRNATVTDANTGPRSPTLSSALAAAGGISRDADIRRLTVNRFLPSGETDSITINMWDSVISANAPQDVILRDGDAIFVPKLEGSGEVDKRLLAKSSLAPITVRVRVVGEVRQPGQVLVPPNSSISQAIAIAGGPTVDAKLRDVAFIRMNENGQVEAKRLNLRSLSDDNQIQDGDVIVVPKTTFASVLDYIGRLVGPIGFFSGFFR